MRPLVEEAWRCYNTGATRASIAATWTAVTADIITKVIRLADEQDGRASTFRQDLMAAQKLGLDPEGVRKMQQIEDSLLSTALDLELIDSIGKRELQRIRQDRNLCVHPALRTLDEVYEPRPEVARGHLAVALTTLFIHPPTQGTKVVGEFTAYMSDPYFVPSAAHMQARFLDRVREATRRSVVDIAAKHALGVASPATDIALSPEQLADRMVTALEAFASRDRALVQGALRKLKTKFEALDGASKLRVLARLGSLDVFWDMVDAPLAEQLDAMIKELDTVEEGWLLPESAAVLALVRDPSARAQLPSLAPRFDESIRADRLAIAAQHPSPYFVPQIIKDLRTAHSWRVGEQIGQVLLRHAEWLSLEELREALDAWASNYQCRAAFGMPQIAVELLEATTRLGASRLAVFGDFVDAVRAEENADGSSLYSELEAVLKTHEGR